MNLQAILVDNRRYVDDGITELPIRVSATEVVKILKTVGREPFGTYFLYGRWYRWSIIGYHRIVRAWKPPLYVLIFNEMHYLAHIKGGKPISTVEAYEMAENWRPSLGPEVEHEPV